MVKCPELNERFARLCYDSNLSDIKIANELGTTGTTVWKWRTGRVEPKPFYIVMICKYFKVSADWLLGVNE